MKLTTLRAINIPTGSFPANATIETDEEIGGRLLAKGHAAVWCQPIETAEAPMRARENAMVKTRKSRK